MAKKKASGESGKADRAVVKSIQQLQSDAVEAAKQAEKALKEAKAWQKAVGGLNPEGEATEKSMRELQRQLQKRQQMFDMIAEINKTHGKTAKNIISDLGR